MRTKNSFLNFLANTGSYIINLILSFVTRTVFIYTLPQEYLGVNGLFGNILTVLNLAELGIGTAMLYKMYKPVAEKDYLMQQQLMNLFRKLYEIVALVVLLLGLAIIPFLDSLMKDQPDIAYLTGIYLLYLLNTVSTYLLSYKRCIIDSNQKSYIITIISSFFTFFQFLMQIVFLLLTHNFIVYLCIQIICNILTNIVIARQSDKMFPYLRDNRKLFPPKAIMMDIRRKIGAMFLHRLGDVVVNNTDNLIMSSIVGLMSVGIYSNYQMIMGSIKTALNGFFHAFTASIGDVGATDDKERLFHVYKILLFLAFWIYGFTSTAFMTLFNPFIEAWVGADLLFPMSVVAILVINYYIAGMRDVTLIFRDALGLFWYDRYKPLFEVVINLVASLWLATKIGVAGVFLGTTISTMATCFWIEPFVTYKHGFHKNVSHYFTTLILYTLVVIFDGAVTYWLCGFIVIGGILEVIIKLILCLVIYNFIVLLLFHRTPEYQGTKEQVKKLIKAYKEKHQ